MPILTSHFICKDFVFNFQSKVHRIDFDDDNSAISKTTFVHADGEVWSISASTVSRDVIATIYNHSKLEVYNIVVFVN